MSNRGLQYLYVFVFLSVFVISVTVLSNVLISFKISSLVSFGVFCCVVVSRY